MKQLEQRQKDLLRDMEGEENKEERINYLDYLNSKGYDVSMFDCRMHSSVSAFKQGGVYLSDSKDVTFPEMYKGDSIELSNTSTFHEESKMLIQLGWSDYIITSLYTPTPKSFMIIKIATSVLNDQRQKQVSEEENILDYLHSRENLKMFSIDENMLNGVTHIKLEICL